MNVEAREEQFVTFSLDRQIFAVPVSVVREILDHEEPARLPQGPEFLLGLRDVRGHGVPVIDLRLKLGMSATIRTLDTRTLVLDVPLGSHVLPLGLVADRVFEVTTFDQNSFAPAPEVGVSWNSSYIAGVSRKETGFVVILDVKQLFSKAEHESGIIDTLTGLV